MEYLSISYYEYRNIVYKLGARRKYIDGIYLFSDKIQAQRAIEEIESLVILNKLTGE